MTYTYNFRLAYDSRTKANCGKNGFHGSSHFMCGCFLYRQWMSPSISAPSPNPVGPGLVRGKKRLLNKQQNTISSEATFKVLRKGPDIRLKEIQHLAPHVGPAGDFDSSHGAGAKTADGGSSSAVEWHPALAMGFSEAPKGGNPYEWTWENCRF